MQFLARLMDHVLAERGERATIVGATSGDTGGAAIEAFRGRERIDIAILFPDGRVSPVQRRQMTTAREANVQAIAIEGTFDDAQALVKGMFNDARFRERVRLSGVNSINWGRIVAQIVYYFTAAVALGAPHRPVSFTVPTGNFGNIFAGYAAKRMGLPIERLVVATNVNDILHRTLQTGRYEVRGVTATSSPSMDIQVSSNFERLLFEVGGPRRGRGPALDGGPRPIGRLHARREGARDALPTDFASGAADEAETAATIARAAARRRHAHRPAHGGRRRGGRAASRRNADGRRWRPRIRPSSPTRWRRPAASARSCRTGRGRSCRARRSIACSRPISARSSRRSRARLRAP